MKTIVLILLAAIVVSLLSGLFFLTKGQRDSAQMLNALKMRVLLSVVLIVFLVSSFHFGWIGPQ